MYIFYFQKLNVWKESRKLIPEIYKITSAFPKDERFSLTDQIRRCAISVSANIAEGMGRKGNKDQARFTSISYGSLMELLTLLITSCDLNYLEQEKFNDLQDKIESIAKKLSALRESQLKYKRK